MFGIEKIKQVINKQSKRQLDYVLNCLTNNLGKCIINKDDGVIHCYVDNEKIINVLQNNKRFKLGKGYPLSFNNEIKEILDLPIVYIFQNINFSGLDGLKFNVEDNCSLYFNNCIFEDDVYIIGNSNNIVFFQNDYLTDNNNGNFFLHVNGAKKVEFTNDKLYDSSYFYKVGRASFKVDICADKVQVVNTEIGERTIDEISIKTNYLEIINSRMFFKDAYIKSKIIDIDYNTSVLAVNGIMLDMLRKNCRNKGTVMSNLILFSEYKVIEEEKKLNDMRCKLVYLLENIMDNCNDNINRKVSRYKDKLEEKRVLKLVKNNKSRKGLND